MTRSHCRALTPSSSQPTSPSEPGWVRSATKLTSLLPKGNDLVFHLSRVAKLVPALLASYPSTRSSSVEWPTDSWMVRKSWLGSITRSQRPASTERAVSSLGLGCGKVASSTMS